MKSILCDYCLEVSKKKGKVNTYCLICKESYKKLKKGKLKRNKENDIQLTINTNIIYNKNKINVVDVDTIKRLTKFEKTMILHVRHEWLERQRKQDKKEKMAQVSKIYNLKQRRLYPEKLLKSKEKHRIKKRKGLKCIICGKDISKEKRLRVYCKKHSLEKSGRRK